MCAIEGSGARTVIVRPLTGLSRAPALPGKAAQAGSSSTCRRWFAERIRICEIAVNLRWQRCSSDSHFKNSRAAAGRSATLIFCSCSSDCRGWWCCCGSAAAIASHSLANAIASGDRHAGCGRLSGTEGSALARASPMLDERHAPEKASPLRGGRSMSCARGRGDRRFCRSLSPGGVSEVELEDVMRRSPGSPHAGLSKTCCCSPVWTRASAIGIGRRGSARRRPAVDALASHPRGHFGFRAM